MTSKPLIFGGRSNGVYDACEKSHIGGTEHSQLDTSSLGALGRSSRSYHGFLQRLGSTELDLFLLVVHHGMENGRYSPSIGGLTQKVGSQNANPRRLVSQRMDQSFFLLVLAKD